jgi:hypothetical protein
LLLEDVLYGEGADAIHHANQIRVVLQQKLESLEGRFGSITGVVHWSAACAVANLNIRAAVQEDLKEFVLFRLADFM